MSGNDTKGSDGTVLPIIPNPREVIINEERYTFLLRTSTIILFPDAKVQFEAELLSEFIQARTGFTLSVQQSSEHFHSSDGTSIIELSINHADADENNPSSEEQNQAYVLSATSKQVQISSHHGAGLLYGIQTLRQLLQKDDTANTWSMPCVTIKDSPRFPKWRGLHLDVGRHFFPVSDIKRFIDLMSLYKYNVFHWHLTEDQGWRIEIDKYPLLTEIGSKRDATPILSDRENLDGTPYGPYYYTKEEVKEIVAYAEARHIRVVPEIEMPGHTAAVLAAYPNLGCLGKDYSVKCYWGVEHEVFCAGNEDIFTFLQDVLNEVMELFPNSEFIHIGGDECPKKRWRECPKCQRRIEKEGLVDEKALQSYFIRRIEKFLNGHGRRLIGWDEILEGGLAPNAAVMSWRGTEGGIEAATSGHEVVMTPTSHCYLDYYQTLDADNEPPAIGGHLPLSKCYEFDPTFGVAAEDQKFILGGQGNVWTEYIPTMQKVEYMTYPRAAALAESLWSMTERRHFRDFCDRLEEQRNLLDSLGVNYHRRKEQGQGGQESQEV